jgi:hypothetical protein
MFLQDFELCASEVQEGLMDYPLLLNAKQILHMYDIIKQQEQCLFNVIHKINVKILNFESIFSVSYNRPNRRNPKIL